MPDIKQIVYNKKANFEYEIIDKYEAGIELYGTEVKSLREGKCSIGEAYIIENNGELFIKNMNISEYKNGNINNHNPKRDRKLLLKKKEIKEIKRAISEKGLTAIPLSLYFKDSLIKVTVAVVKGKKLYDKRETIKEKENDRNLSRIMKNFNN